MDHQARGWIIAIGAFVAMATVFGVAYSFGAFFDAMGAELGASASRTAAVFSITTALFFVLGVFTGRLGDRHGARPLLLFAAVALGIGLWSTSRVTSVEAGYLTYGVGVGLAVAAGYVPSVAAVGRWFGDRRAAPMAFSIAGIGAGTLIATPLAAWLIDTHGWRSAYELMAAVGTGLLLVAALAIGPHDDAGGRETGAIRFSVLRDRSAVGLYAAATVLALALFVPFVFLPPYAEGQGVDPVQAALLVGVLGGGSVLARLVSGPAANAIGSLRTYRWCFVILALSYALWMAAGSSFGMIAIFAAVNGFAYGGYVAVSALVIAEAHGTTNLGSALGIYYTGAAFGGLVGPPLAGAVLDATDSYLAVMVACAGLLTAATLILVAAVPMDSDGSMPPIPQR